MTTATPPARGGLGSGLNSVWTELAKDPVLWWGARSAWYNSGHGNKRTAKQFVGALKECTKMRDLKGGKKLHLEAAEARLDTINFVAVALITMYSKCHSMALAKQVFDKVIQPDIFTWTSLILGYVDSGEPSVALELFTCMDCKPDHLTFTAALRACASLGREKESGKHVYLEKGITIHKQIKSGGYEGEIVVANTLIHMYSECGSMKDAREVFDGIVSKNSVSWNTLIMGYVENGEDLAALDLFNSMDCERDSFSYVAALKACGSLASVEGSEKRLCLEKGIAIHKQAKASGLDHSRFVAGALVDMYSKCGDMHSAREVFDKMVFKDGIVWNSLMQGYVQNGLSLVALDLLSCMDCEPSAVTFVTALKACAVLAVEKNLEKRFCLEKGIAIHKQARDHDADSNVYVASTLLDMYCKCGRMDLARQVFDGMVSKNVVSWNSLLLGYVINGESLVAMDLFSSMDCEPDTCTYMAALKAYGESATEKESQKHKSICFEKARALQKQVKEHGLDSEINVANNLVDTYSKCGNMDCAREVFDAMASKTVVSWNSLILGYVQNGKSSLAMDLFARMDFEPDNLTYITALQACGTLASVATGQQIHARLLQGGLLEDLQVVNSLMSMYAKCGSMIRAQECFDNISSPDIVSWNALIGAYSSCGAASRVFSLVKKMHECGVRMDSITFVCILATCSHAGLVREGKLYFNFMQEYGLNPDLEHYTCVVDMLGRVNSLQEAFDLARSMPFEDSSTTWKALLGACQKWKNLEIGKAAFDALVKADNTDGGPYVLMSDIYGSLGMWEDMEQLQAQSKLCQKT